ncbi:MAG: hypothetical protein O7D86_10020 [Proteobacteria bacterium]|nr:hypothetical protein [Pseudomonadota bacterium]
MAKKPIMSLGTINTILNTAPIVIQGATRLIKLIRDQGNDNKPEEKIPETIEGIKNEVESLHQRLNANDESNVEQIKLIEELARQNESLATQLKNTITHLNRVTIIASIAILISFICLAYLIK